MTTPPKKGGKRYSADEQLAHDLAHALEDLPDNWIVCRDMRHAWNVENDFHVTESKGSKVQEIRRELSCMRCETVRKEVYHINAFGLEKVAQYYTYPEHYQLHGVPRGVKPSYIVQGEQYRRTLERLSTAKKKAVKKP